MRFHICSLPIRPGECGHEIARCEKMKPEVLYYAAVASIATILPESVMAVVAKDERVCRIMPDLEAICNDDRLFVGEIKPAVWMRLAATATGVTDQDNRLRDDCMLASAVAHAFIDYRVFKVAKAMPWSLCQGDIKKNVESLHEHKDTQGDEFAAKILRLKEQDHFQIRMGGSSYRRHTHSTIVSRH